MSDKEKQIEEMAEFIHIDSSFPGFEEDALHLAEEIYNAGYRKQSYVIDTFVERLKEMPIKYGLPVLGLSTKTEIEDYVDGLLMQFRNAIDAVSSQMKGDAE